MATSNRLFGESKVAQVIYSESRRIFLGAYLTKKGKRLTAEAKESFKGKALKAALELINAKYEKNRYGINANAVPTKTIYHRLYNEDRKVVTK